MFLDPPFYSALLQDCVDRLEQHGWLAESAWIYIEAEAGSELVLPPHWHWHRDQQAGQVRYRLARRQADSES